VVRVVVNVSLVALVLLLTAQVILILCTGIHQFLDFILLLPVSVLDPLLEATVQAVGL